MLESLKKNKKGIMLMLFSSVCVCLGQLLWKLSVEYGYFMIFAGVVLYVVGAMSMIVAYKFGKLSVLQPILSMNYVLSIILAAIVLKENISLLKCIGVLGIIIGVIFIAGGDKE